MVAALASCSRQVDQPIEQPQPPRSTERRIVSDGSAPFCAISQGGIDGVCGNSVDECQKLRSRTDSDCEPWTSAACFEGRLRVSGQVVRFCTPSIRQCDRFILTHTDDIETNEDRCFLFRQ